MLRWSLRLGSLLGVPVFVHWTFLLLLAWMMARPVLAHGVSAWRDGLWSVAFVIAVFACVLLHEMGHALAARLYSIRTRDIVLLPIGGVARLERMPERPWQEVVVAIAGPLVNVFLVVLLLPVALLRSGGGGFSLSPSGELSRSTFLPALCAANIMLVAFNAIPAFPMDGGRVLRALMSLAMPRSRATMLAARSGQFVAVLLGATALFTGQFVLLLIAFFIFMAARDEAAVEHARAAVQGLRVRDVMLTRFSTMPAGRTVGDAADDMLRAGQFAYPVIADTTPAWDDACAIVGSLTRNDVMQALAHQRGAEPVQSLMTPGCPCVGEDEELEAVLHRIAGDASARDAEAHVVAVVRPAQGAGIPERRIVGLVTPENIQQALSLRVRGLGR